jgi:hypothetical protein
MKKRKKRTPEERAAERDRRADLDERMLALIERYRAAARERRRTSSG